MSRRCVVVFGSVAEKLKEYKASFIHFDEDELGQLDYEEFSKCLQSQGQSLTAAQMEAVALEVGIRRRCRHALERVHVLRP